MKNNFERQEGVRGSLKSLLFFIFIICLISNTSKAVWTSYGTDYGYEIWGTDFVNANTGWIIGANGRIQKTINGGISWQWQGSYSDVFRNIKMFDSNTGIISGHNGKILNTTNSGLSWTLNTGAASFFGMDAQNSQNIICVGSSKNYSRTTDGGNTWTHGVFNVTGLTSINFDLYGIEYLDSNTIFLSSSPITYFVIPAPVILRSTNGGANFSVVKTWGFGEGFDNVGLNDIEFSPSGTVGLTCASNGTVLRTTNNGTNWSTVLTSAVDLRQIEFKNNDSAYICGSSGNVFITTNGGLNWANWPNTGTTYNLRSISYADNLISAAGINGTFIRNITQFNQVTVTNASTGNGNYENLSDAFIGIGAGSQAGANINITINTNITEPPQGATPGNGDWTSVTIKPAMNSAITVTATPNNGVPLFSFNGAKNITIDGINSGNTSLTLSNSSASGWAGTSTVLFQYDASNNRIKNCKILGASQNNLSGHAATVLFYRNSSTTGNDNNVIENCDIGQVGTQPPHCAVSFLGSTTNTTVNSSFDTVRNCKIYDFFNLSNHSAGIHIGAGNTNIAIENNRIYQTVSRVATGTNLNHYGIFINNSNGNAFSIKGNTIGYSSSSETGLYSLNLKTGSYFYGILISAGTSAETSVSDNSIAGFDISGSSAGVNLVNITQGLTLIKNNTIGSQTTISNIKYASGVSEFHAFKFEGAGNKTVTNNIIGGIRYSALSSNFYTMRFISTGNSVLNCSNNILGGTIANSLQHHLANTSSLMTGISFEGSGSPDLLIEKNTIRNINSAATNSNPGTSGIYINLSAGNQIIRNNLIHSISITNTTSACALSGIRINNGNNGIASSNNIHSLIISNSNSSLNGILINNGSYEFTNNMISLGKDIAGGNMSAGSSINGINLSNNVLCNLYFNSVYISGNPTSGSMNTFALASYVTANTRNYFNNIFYNGRSNSGSTGKHYAIRLEGTSPNPAGISCNYNDLIVTGSGSNLGFFNNGDVSNLSAWKTITGKDSNSVSDNPRFISYTNLHIDTTKSTSISNSGINLISIPTDIDSNIRNVSSPDIGSDEFNSTITAQALNLDGTNDYVSLPNSLTQAFTAPTVSEFTIEYWFKGTNIQSAVRFQANGSSYIVAGWGSTIGDQKHLISSDGGIVNGIAVGANVTDGNWHHVAVTWKKNTVNGFRSYLDGVLVAQRNSANADLPSLNVPAYLGSQDGTGEFLNGSLDEVRIWTRSLGQTEIAANMFREIDSADALLASYHFNKGIASGNNAGVTSLTDYTGNYNGTLNNFDLNGNSSNWIQPGPGFCSQYVEISVKGNNIAISDGDVTPSVSDNTDFGTISADTISVKTFTIQNTGSDSLSLGSPLFTGADSVGFSASPFTPLGKIPPGGSTSFNITFKPASSGIKTTVVHIPNNDSDEYDYDFSLKGTGLAATAQVLNFDGINDHVILPNTLTQNLTAPSVSEFTIEYWFKGSNIQSAVRFQNGGSWIVAGWGNPGSEKHLISTEGGTNGISVGAGVTDGNWHHVAMTWKKNTVNGFKSYLDGALVEQRNSSNTDLPNMNISGYLGLYNGGNEMMNGTLDEVRIWTRELSQTEISSNRFLEISSGAGLLASYHFNQGFAGDVNTGVTTLNDATSNNYSGTLANFALNGTASNWLAFGPGLTAQTHTINISVIPEGFYNASTDKLNLSDTLRVYLHSGVSPFSVVDSATGIIDSATYTGSFTFHNAPAGNYYIRLVHRNSIETWSSNTQSLSGNTSYDFTSLSSQAFGNNMIQVDTSPLKFAIFSGDVNQDGTVDASDVSVADNDAYNSVSGYVNTDVTGDNFVDAGDVSIVDNNAFNSVSVVSP